MAIKFNPLTGNFDFTGSGGGASYIDGEVATYADLPLDGSAALNSAWLVRTASGVWPVSRKQAGIYIRTATGGSNRDSDYTYAGTMPDVFSDSQFLLYDNTDTSKNLAFDLGSISTGTTRTLTAPNASGRIQIEGQPIGNTTPAAGAFTTLSTTGALTSANGTAGTPTALSTALGVQWSSLGGSDIAAVYGTYAGSGKVGIGVGTSGVLTEVAAFSLGGITLNRAVTANNGTLTASAPVLDLSQTWNAAGVSFVGLRFDVTNTASATGSRVLHFTVGGTNNLLGIYRDAAGISASPRFEIGSSGVSWNIRTRTGGGVGCNFSDIVGLGSSLQFGVGSGTTAGDLILQRDAANIFAQVNGTNGQTFRIYNTYTDASNYERGFMRWSSNVLQIGSEAAGTGTNRNLELYSGGALRMTLSTASGVVLPGASALAWGGGGSRIIGATSPAGLLQFQTGSTDRITIDANGIIGIGGTTSSFPALKRSSATLQVRLADDSADAPLSAASITLGAGTATAPSFSLSGSTVGFYQRGVGEIAFTDGSEPQMRMYQNTCIFNSDFAVGWGNSTTAPTGLDTILRRDAAGTLAQYNGANAQAYRLYNTFASTNSFERLNVRWASNECIIDAEAGSGGGTLRGIKIGSATSSLLGFYGATPVVQQAAVADATDAASTQARLNDLLARLRTLGLIAT